MLLLKNANIHSLTPQPTKTQAILIDQEKIKALGDSSQFDTLPQKDLEIVDLEGKTIFPGLCDSHLHLAYLGKFLSAVNCETETKAQCLENLRERAKNTPPGEWIYGHGWNHNQWEGGYGTIQDLDAISRNHPIFLTAKSLHAAWANSKAFSIAGINRNSENPPGGEFGRNKDGNLNGLLFENALTEVEKHIPQPNDNQMEEILSATQTHLWQFGITAVHDFDRIACFRGLQKLQADDRLGLRVLKTIPVAELDSYLNSGILAGFGNEFIRLGPVKMFADGALGPQTAAMLEAYENQPGHFGNLLLSEEEIFEAGKKAVKNHLPLAVHAIGDLANRVVLNAFELLRNFEAINGYSHPKHRIEHVQVIHQEDIPRFKQLNIIASMQPIHLISDMTVAEKHWGNRSAFTYAFNALLNSGANLIFGSDAPVESANPFIGMFSALNRKGLNGLPSSGWYPEQCINLEAVLNAYSVNPASSANWNSIGSLRPGAYADLIILPEDPFQIPKEKLLTLKPIKTMVGGQWVWSGEDQ